MKKMKQGASLKRCNATLMPPRIKVMRQNKSFAVLFGSTSKVLTKNEDGRPETIMTKLWQLMQSRDTKNLNLDKDLEEILSKMKQTGWSEAAKTRRFWAHDEDEEQEPS